MKLDDYAEFNDEKPDEDYDEPGGKNNKNSSPVTKAVMAVLVIAVLALIGVAVLYSFKNDEEDQTEQVAAVPSATIKQENKDSSAGAAGENVTGTGGASAPESSESDSDEIRTEFMPDNSQVTAKDVVNLRSMPSTTNENCVILGTLSKGEVLTRTGINYELGWSRLEYNGQIVYAVTSYLEVVK